MVDGSDREALLFLVLVEQSDDKLRFVVETQAADRLAIVVVEEDCAITCRVPNEDPPRFDYRPEDGSNDLIGLKLGCPAAKVGRVTWPIGAREQLAYPEPNDERLAEPRDLAKQVQTDPSPLLGVVATADQSPEFVPRSNARSAPR